MKNECNIIRDILPLYVEDMVSADTSAFVEEHLTKCAECCAELENLKSESLLGHIPSDKYDTDTLPMKTIKKKWKSKKIALICFTALITAIVVLWLTGVIPTQIAKISGTIYVNEQFPEMQLECVGVEYADAFGDYLITFKGTNENTYSCVIGPKYFPVSMGQGLFAIESDYAEYYKDKLIYGDTHDPNADNSEYAVSGEGEPLAPTE